MPVKTIKASVATHFFFWLCTLTFVCVVVYALKGMLLPFVLGIAVAYFLNPLVDVFKKYGIARKPATILILGSFFLVILSLFSAMIPIMTREIGLFVSDLPLYVHKLSELIAPISAMLDKYIGGADEEAMKTLLKQNSASAVNVTKVIVAEIAAGGQAVFDLLTVITFMPVVSYFMMIEWPKICKWLHSLIPVHAEKTIMELFEEVNKKLAGFVRGQITVSVFLGIGYAIALMLAGLKYGVLIGIGSGILSVIPMVGSAIGLFVSVAVAWLQTGDLSFMGLIAAIFLLGQFIEGNFLTPKLVGDSVGLHPLWVFFALLAGGSVLGLLGMFMAVPVAATLGVLISFALTQYKNSKYYNDFDLDSLNITVGSQKDKKEEKNKSKNTKKE